MIEPRPMSLTLPIFLPSLPTTSLPIRSWAVTFWSSSDCCTRLMLAVPDMCADPDMPGVLALELLFQLCELPEVEPVALDEPVVPVAGRCEVWPVWPGWLYWLDWELLPVEVPEPVVDPEPVVP